MCSLYHYKISQLTVCIILLWPNYFYLIIIPEANFGATGFKFGTDVLPSVPLNRSFFLYIWASLTAMTKIPNWVIMHIFNELRYPYSNSSESLSPKTFLTSLKRFEKYFMSYRADKQSRAKIAKWVIMPIFHYSGWQWPASDKKRPAWSLQAGWEWGENKGRRLPLKPPGSQLWPVMHAGTTFFNSVNCK